MKKERNRRRIVITGSWGGGKTTILRELQTDPHYEASILVIPEAAPLARSIGYTVDSERFEQHVVALQRALEDMVDTLESKADNRAILMHRGTLDAFAFWLYQGGEKKFFFDKIDSKHSRELLRYDVVIFLRTTAQYAPEIYELYRQKANRPPAEEAVRLEAFLNKAWDQHPCFFSIGEENMSWPQKADLVKAIVDAHLSPSRRPSRQEVNDTLSRIQYPSSHLYIINAAGQVQPQEKGKLRLQEMEEVVPDFQWDSLIDIGCAKGMFLLWAWQRYGLRRMVGVEAASDMVNACRKAVFYLNAPATILQGSLLELYRALPSACLVFVLHCYHYLYFGAPGIASHDQLFDILAHITDDTLVFANPLNLSLDKINLYRQKKISPEVIESYNAQAILESANRYFKVQKIPLGKGRPYLVMKKR